MPLAHSRGRAAERCRLLGCTMIPCLRLAQPCEGRGQDKKMCVKQQGEAQAPTRGNWCPRIIHKFPWRKTTPAPQTAMTRWLLLVSQPL